MTGPGLCVSLLHRNRFSIFRITKLKKQLKITAHQTLKLHQMQEGQTQIIWPIPGLLCALNDCSLLRVFQLVPQDSIKPTSANLWPQHASLMLTLFAHPQGRQLSGHSNLEKVPQRKMQNSCNTSTNQFFLTSKRLLLKATQPEEHFHVVSKRNCNYLLCHSIP